jgi:hypothetical protein
VHYDHLLQGSEKFWSGKVVRGVFHLFTRMDKGALESRSIDLGRRILGPKCVSMCLYSDSRAQGLGDTSCIPKDRGKQLEGRKERKGREEEKEERREVFLD